MSLERRRAAIHEAGHAIAAQLLDVPIAGVSIGDGDGVTRLASIDAPRADRAIVALAGSTAELLAGYPEQPAAHDEAVAVRLAAGNGGTDVLRIRTARLLAPHRSAILRLASALEDAGALEGPALSAAVTAAMKEMSRV